MDEITLESHAKRVAALALRTHTRCRKDWRSVVGMFGESEFMREVDEECSLCGNWSVSWRGAVLVTSSR
jgi:hypothetical protein